MTAVLSCLAVVAVWVLVGVGTWQLSTRTNGMHESSQLYRKLCKAAEEGVVWNRRKTYPWDNERSWTVTVGSVDVMFFENRSAHFDGPDGQRHVILRPRRLRRAVVAQVGDPTVFSDASWPYTDQERAS